MHIVMLERDKERVSPTKISGCLIDQGIYYNTVRSNFCDSDIYIIIWNYPLKR